jgi:autotransporter-associated beta strand protein
MTVANTISGAGSVSLLQKSGTDWNTAKGGIVTLTGNNTYTGVTWLNPYAQLELGSGGTSGSLSSSSQIYMHVGTNLISNRSDDVTIGNQLVHWASYGPTSLNSQAGNDFIQNGTGTVTLSNNSNNFYGMTRINAGSITFNNTGSFGNSSNQISFGGGAIKYVAGNQTDYSNKFGTAANQQYSVDVNGQAITWATALNSSNGSLTVKDSVGTGSLNLTANNTYSGATNINGGNLTFSGSGAAASSTALNIGGNASYTLSNTTALSNTGSMSLSVASGGNLTLSANRTFGSISGAGNITLGSNSLTTGTNNNSTTYSGVMSGTGALSKTGTGTLTLSSSNTYSGGTTISNGTIKLGSAASLGASNATVSSGATLDLNGQNAVANNLSVNGTGVSSVGALYNSSISAASTSGNITLAGNTTIKSLGDITLNSTVQSSNNGSLTIDATGKTVTLNGLIGADPTTLAATSSLNPSSVTITGDTINLNNDIASGAQTFNGAINVGDNGTNGTTRTVLAVGTSPSTIFNGTINDTVANTHTLNTRAVTTSINNTPTITFNGNVGQIKALAGMETSAMYQPSASGSVFGALPATTDTSSNYSGTINVNGAFKTTGDQTFTGKTLDFATNQPASISGDINIYGFSATSGGANTSTINIPGFKVTSGTQTIKGLSADQLLTVAKTIDKTIDPNFVATVSGSGGSAGTNNAGRVKFDAGLGSKIIKDIAVPKSIFSSPIQSGGSLKPSINIGEVYVDGLSNNIGAPVITNNFSQPGAGNAFIRQPKDE